MVKISAAVGLAQGIKNVDVRHNRNKSQEGNG